MRVGLNFSHICLLYYSIYEVLIASFYIYSLHIVADWEKREEEQYITSIIGNSFVFLK